MQAILITKLYEHLRSSYPDLLFDLQAEGKVTSFLQQHLDLIAGLIKELEAQGTPAYIMEEACMPAIDRNLGPSKFLYVSNILEEDFPEVHSWLHSSGILAYEATNMIKACNPLFDTLGFTEDSDNDRQLRYAVIGEIHEYLADE